MVRNIKNRPIIKIKGDFHSLREIRIILIVGGNLMTSFRDLCSVSDSLRKFFEG